MAKLLVLIVLVVCVTLASCHRGPPRGSGNGGQDRRRNWNRTNGDGRQDRWTSKLCPNGTLVPSYLIQNRQLIITLRSNASLAPALQNRQQFIAFIEDDDTDLLSSNCTAFVSGLRDAKNLDRAALKQQRQLDRSVGWSFFKIIRSLVGDNSS